MSTSKTMPAHRTHVRLDLGFTAKSPSKATCTALMRKTQSKTAPVAHIRNQHEQEHDPQRAQPRLNRHEQTRRPRSRRHFGVHVPGHGSSLVDQSEVSMRRAPQKRHENMGSEFFVAGERGTLYDRPNRYAAPSGRLRRCAGRALLIMENRHGQCEKETAGRCFCLAHPPHPPRTGPSDGNGSKEQAAVRDVQQGSGLKRAMGR